MTGRKYIHIFKYLEDTKQTTHLVAPATGDIVLADGVRFGHDLHATVLVVDELVAVHLAVDAVLHPLHLVSTQTHTGALAAHDLVVPDGGSVRTAVDT